MLDFVKYLERTWRTPVRLRILDLILLDGGVPCKWIYTDHNDCLQFRRLKDLSLGRIVQSLLSNMDVSAKVHPRWKVSARTSFPRGAATSHVSARTLATGGCASLSRS